MHTDSSFQPSVLFAILDWGMGHATRMAPLIQHAIDRGWVVHVGTKGTALAFLKSQFAGQPIVFHYKPGPEITYAKRGTMLKIVRQIPGFLKGISDEIKWTTAIVEAHDITHIVSDNCYGVRHPEVPAVLISHQLQLPVPRGLERAARLFVQQHAKKFRAVWIPDDNKARLSGRLAFKHPALQARCIGILSRLPLDVQAGPWKKVGMVSGPEPHRSLMEQALMAWMKTTDEPALLIAGRPGAASHVDGLVTIWPNPNAEELASALKGAETIVCRSGYSSLLDMAALGKCPVLIPTPGQPEQVYLARHWAKMFGIATCTQKQLESGQLPTPTGAVPRLEANAAARLALDELVASA
ncbi:MAG: hypothetical protein CMD33_09215 [Flavobacteriales bacterium]|jgi:hypothetical protein|nr:hypothetical protein [Flavobacteriales bacterium]